jgi:pantothenate kinase
MSKPTEEEVFSKVVAEITSQSFSDHRTIVAVAGPPAVGKSTFAKKLVDTLNASRPGTAALLAMDGFHLDNSVLHELNIFERKGAPDSFDFYGFKSVLERMRDRTIEHYVPTFDRTRDIAIGASGVVASSAKIVVVEGNYLLLDKDPWRQLSKVFDYKIFIEASVTELKRRLVFRWMDNGYDAKGAQERASVNDIPNAELISTCRLASDVTWQQDA